MYGITPHPHVLAKALIQLHRAVATLAMNSNGTGVTKGLGDPNGVVHGNIGDIFVRLDDPAAPQVYVKSTDNSNTGWL